MRKYFTHWQHYRVTETPENRQNQTQTSVYYLVSNYTTTTVFHKLKLS